MHDTTPATLPRVRRRSAIGCLTTQPWHNPEGSCRIGSSRLARLHTFYPVRASGPEPVNVYSAGKGAGPQPELPRDVLARDNSISAKVATAFFRRLSPSAKVGGLQPGLRVG